jgi:hypothetical protein
LDGGRTKFTTEVAVEAFQHLAAVKEGMSHTVIQGRRRAWWAEQRIKGAMFEMNHPSSRTEYEPWIPR